VKRTKRTSAVTQRPPQCPWHRPSELGYLAWHEDAERRGAAGEKQQQCPVCHYWFWPHEFGEKPA
jgi:hypothetical protein